MSHMNILAEYPWPHPLLWASQVQIFFLKNAHLEEGFVSLNHTTISYPPFLPFLPYLPYPHSLSPLRLSPLPSYPAAVTFSFFLPINLSSLQNLNATFLSILLFFLGNFHRHHVLQSRVENDLCEVILL